MYARNAWNWMALLVGLGLTQSASAAAEHGSSELNIFNADIGNFIFTLIIFGAVLYILGRFAWKPVLSVLHERERTIRGALETAQAEREKATRLLTEYQVRLDQARAEASAIVAEGRRDAEQLKQRFKDEARREGEELVARARREIQLATDSARKELHDEVSGLAIRVAAGIVRKELTTADHRRLVEESLQEMRASGQIKMN